MKINPERTRLDRLRVVVGYLFAIVGAFVLFVIGSFFGYSNTWIWIIGIGLILFGLLVSGKPKIIEFLSGF